jgi:hypothetical protein
MATTEVIQNTFTSTDGKSLTLGYDPSGNILVQATIQIDGNFFQWQSVEDFQDFVNNVIAMANVVHSPSGSGTGYVPATAGVNGSDAIVD